MKYLLLLASLCLESITITFFGSLLDFIQWQSSTLLGSISTSNFSKMPSTIPSISLFSLVSDMPLSSKYSLLKHWILLHVCRSRLTNFSLSLVFNSLVIGKSDLSCSKSFFKSESSFLTPASVESNLLWQSRARLMIEQEQDRFRKCYDNQENKF